jgi:hypothetical protein
VSFDNVLTILQSVGALIAVAFETTRKVNDRKVVTRIGYISIFLIVSSFGVKIWKEREDHRNAAKYAAIVKREKATAESFAAFQAAKIDTLQKHTVHLRANLDSMNRILGNVKDISGESRRLVEQAKGIAEDSKDHTEGLRYLINETTRQLYGQFVVELEKVNKKTKDSLVNAINVYREGDAEIIKDLKTSVVDQLKLVLDKSSDMEKKIISQDSLMRQIGAYVESAKTLPESSQVIRIRQ